MRPLPRKLIGLTGALVTLSAVLSTSCATDFILNLIEERSGQITVVIINNTPYRAAFSLGSYDALDRDPPGPIDFIQRRIEGNTTSALLTLECRRNVAIGTAEMIARAIDNGLHEEEGADLDAFVPEVNFSSAPADSAAAASPTVGIAEGREVRLGVDFGCGDELIFTLLEDAAAAGGFRVEFDLLPQEQED
jgi:hypothetical protein